MVRSVAKHIFDKNISSFLSDTSSTNKVPGMNFNRKWDTDEFQFQTGGEFKQTQKSFAVDAVRGCSKMSKKRGLWLLSRCNL